MPKAMYAIWWDNTLGPLVGRTAPDSETLSEEEALAIFLGHGVNQEARIGYTNLSRGLIVSIMEPPNCIAVLLEDSDDPQLIERALTRLLSEIDLNSTEWVRNIDRAFSQLLKILDSSTTEQLLSRGDVKRLIADMRAGRVNEILPRHVMKQVATYPRAREYLSLTDEEIENALSDLAAAGVLSVKAHGRRLQCRQCGSNEVEIVLACPTCHGEQLKIRYSLFCPRCGNRIHQMLPDGIEVVVCEYCHASLSVVDLTLIDVDIYCEECGRTSFESNILLYCARCGRHMNLVDILGKTGLAFSLRKQ